MLKILHTGDIHLDSPFARLDPRRAEIRREEVRAAFCAMMAYARTNGVDLVLIAGDVFESGFVTRETLTLLIREFSSLSCPVVIAPGNHDCASPDSVWNKAVFPENVHIFRSGQLEKFSFDALNTDVYGFAFTSSDMTECPLTGHRAQDPERINLLCMHGDTTSPISRKCPVTRADLAAFGADYAALGHIHNPGPIEYRDGVLAAYCGCPEGRGPDEVGPKGAILCEIEKENGKARVRAGRIRFSRRRYENETVSADGADTLGEIETRIADMIREKQYGEDTILRVTLTGAVDPALVVDRAALESRFTELFSVEITDETTPAFSAADFENDRTVRGEFYRTLVPLMESGTPRERRVALLALRYGLAAMSGENISGN